MTKFKTRFMQFVTFVLIIAMVTPHMVFATESPWAQLPEIAPYSTVPFEWAGVEDYSATQLMDLLLRMDEFTSFTTEEQRVVMAHLGMENDPLSPVSLTDITRIIEAEGDYQLRELVQYALLLNSGAGFSALSAADRALIFRQLDIAFESHNNASASFQRLERDRYTLTESVEIMRVLSSGLFDYAEARAIFASFPCTMERLTAVMRFEQLAQRLDVADSIYANRLVNRPFASDVEAVELDDTADAESLFDEARQMFLDDYGFEAIAEVIDFAIASVSTDLTPVNFHEQITNNPFDLWFNVDDSVSLLTGASMFHANILSLPGRGGFGFNLDMRYLSSNAELRRPTGEFLPGVYVGTTIHTYNITVSNGTFSTLTGFG